ncbi:hypothetical protein CK203_062749 [Vitis vinifera]|uniref:Transposase MuDR plant domain-containing protein n=1 Tax=Vitis vinifera TaxID=29760 RepID=A0A438GAR6_VITVI|nr:hypothetical protein CK203_062749 [Vitis vinifera]
MFRFNDMFCHVYVFPRIEVGEGLIAQTSGLTPIVVSNSTQVISSHADPPTEINIHSPTIESFGFSQQCAESNVVQLESRRFRYSFTRNTPKHMTVVCTITQCPWKVIARAIGDSKIVQVHTFRNVHNHSLEDVSSSQPLIRSNRASLVIDDVIRSTPNYQPSQILSIQGFALGCRPVIAIDSSHMSGPYGEKEVVIISDKHPALLRSVPEVFGLENHAYCYRHLKENFSTFVKHDYNVSMYELRKYNDALATWVEDNSPEHWAMSKFPKQRWDKMTTNLAESFNAWLRHERHHSICNFLMEHMAKLGYMLGKYKE